MSIAIIPRKIKVIPTKGKCLVYDVVDESTGEMFEDGVISLDLTWMSPSSMMKNEGANWYKVYYSDALQEYTYYNLYHQCREISSKVINAVVDIVAEKHLLEEDHEC